MRVVWPRIWEMRDSGAGLDGFVFVVDAADRTRFPEAKEELHSILQEPRLAHLPVAVLGNKTDIPVAACEEELRRALELDGSGEVRRGAGAAPVELFMMSVVRQSGLEQGFRWLSQLSE